MATTTKLSLIDQKIEELTKTIIKITNADTVNKDAENYMSENTRSTQLYARKRERRVLHLIKSLVETTGDSVKLSTEDMDTFVLLTTLAEERVTTKYVFHEGDSILEIMTKYQNLSRKDLEKRLEKLGLALDFTSGKIVKA